MNRRLFWCPWVSAASLVFLAGSAEAVDPQLSVIRLADGARAAANPAAPAPPPRPAPPPTRPADPLKATYEVADWTGRAKAPEQIPAGPNVRTVVVVARSITFADRKYRVADGTCPANVVVIADVVRFEGEVSFDVSHHARPGVNVLRPPDRSVANPEAGSLTVVAGTVSFAPASWVTVPADGAAGLYLPPRTGTRMVPKPGGGVMRGRLGGGGPPPNPPLVPVPYTIPEVVIPGTNGGALRLVAGQAEDGTEPAVRAAGIREVWARHGKASVSGGRGAADGTQEVGWAPEPTAAGLPEGMIADWLGARASYLSAAANDLAVRKPDGYRKRLYELFQEFARAPRFEPALANARYAEAVARLRQLQAALYPQLWEADPVRVSAAGLVYTLHPLAEGLTDRVHLPPTTALVRPLTVNDRRYLGLLWSDPDSGALELTCELALTVDPLVEAAAVRALSERGERYAGPFREWVLTPGREQIAGVRRVSVTAEGPTLFCRVALDPNGAATARTLALLASPAGLPVRLHWAYRKDTRFQGQPFDLHITMTRQANPPVRIDGGKLKNLGQVPVAVEYLRVGPRYKPLDRAIVLRPRQGEPVQTDDVQVPAEAVRVEVPAGNGLLEHFWVVRTQTASRVEVANLVAAARPDGKRLTGMRLMVTYATGGKSPLEVRTGPYDLAPAGEPGSRLTLTFPRVGSGIPKVTVTGLARFSDGTTARFQLTQADPLVLISAPDLVKD